VRGGRVSWSSRTSLSGSGAEQVVGGDPERVGIREGGIDVCHPVDEFGRGGAAVQNCREVGQVAAAFLDLPAGVVIGCPWVAVTGDEGART
jgi:hypothetical protein